MFQKLKSVVVFLKIIVTSYLIVKCFKKLFFEKKYRVPQVPRSAILSLVTPPCTVV